jgi:V/A-type H+/Na+-transporting ATPase subunit C
MVVLDETIYAYAVGRIRALETRLLDRSRYERMIDANSAEETLKVLAESDYANAVGEMAGVHDFESLLSNELRNTFNTVLKLSPNPKEIAALALRYDVHNLKVLFKEKFLGIKSDLIIGAGTLDPEKLEIAINEDDFRDLPEKLRQASEKISEEFPLNRNPQLIDLALDQVLYSQLLEEADKNKSEFLKGLFKRQIDLVNLKSLIRVKRMGLDREFLRKVLLPGGMLPLDRLISLVDEPLESIITSLAMSDYSELVGEGVRDWIDRGTASRLEKLSDDYITNYLKRGKWTPFGPEPLIGYRWAKEMEIKNIRLILVGKINKLPAEAIRERLRDGYL